MKEKELKHEDYERGGEVHTSSGRTKCPISLFFKKEKASTLEQTIKEIILRNSADL